MNLSSICRAIRPLAVIVLVAALAPAARGHNAGPAATAAQGTEQKAAAATMVLAQGRCFNGRCY